MSVVCALGDFHSTKEGFKGHSWGSVSLSPTNFHSTKEGFKAPRRR